MIVALHVHTNHSACGESRPDEIASYCRDRGIDVVGITDHNTIEGALEMSRFTAPPRIIVGEEISTNHGEIIGLFLNERVPPRLDARETCLRIKEQGGLVYVPHPFDRFKVTKIRREPLLRILDLVDIIEVHNSKISLARYNAAAATFAREHGKVGAAGSDSHYVRSIDAALNVMDSFDGPGDFLDKLARAQLRTGVSSLLATGWIRVRKLLGIS